MMSVSNHKFLLLMTLFMLTCLSVLAQNIAKPGHEQLGHYASQISSEEELINQRIFWLKALKEFAAKKVWKDFKGRRISLVYFTDSLSYIADAKPRMLKKLDIDEQHRVSGSPLYRSKRIDQRNFHMETAVEAVDSAVFYYQNPVAMASSYEESKKTMEDISSLQQWASMIIHEYFHGYQFQHAHMLRYSNDSIVMRGSELQGLYRTHTWFSESVIRENGLLLAALKANYKKERDSVLLKFIELREDRRNRTDSLLKSRFSSQEDFYEKTEGSAKYVELSLLEHLKQFPANTYLSKQDTAYKARAYQEFKLSDQPWLYDTSSANYFYSTGYNLLKVLDRLGIPFKKNFFDSSTNAYSLLKRYYQSHSF